MVRFQWHVEDGLGASVGPGQLVYLRDHGVLQAMVEIEMPGGSGSLEACMNIPQNYNTDSGVKELGIIMAHGSDASDWRGRLLAELAVSLARAGFLVMRYICHPHASEARRVAVFEKAADAAATSPYARGVTRWVLAGLGGGARVAALAGGRLRSSVAGYALLSYPLKEEMPDMPTDGSGAAPPAGDSSGPLLGLAAPLLFVNASTDPLVSEAALMELGPRMAASDVRSVVLQDVDSHFRTLTGKGPHAATVRAITAALHEFLNATNAYRMDFCKLPRIWRGGAGAGAPAPAAAASENGGGKADRPQLQRPACFRPLPTGPPQQVLAQQQQQQQLAAAAHAPGLPYGLTASAAQALAAQIQQRQAAAAGAAGGGGAAAQLLAQQVLLQQAAAAAAASAAQRRTTSDHVDVGPASAAGKLAAAAATAARAGAGAQNPQLAGLAHVLSDPNAAAQIAAMLIRNSAAAQQQQVLQLGGDGAAAAGQAGRGGGGGAALSSPGGGPGAAAGGGGGAGTQALTMEALTSALVQRLAQPQQMALGAGAVAGGATLQQQQQLQQLLLQHQRQQQQQQQQRQQLTLQLQEQLLQRQQQQGLQPGAAMLLQNSAALQAAAMRPAGGRGGAVGPSGVLMLHAAGSGGLLAQAGSGHDGDDEQMEDAGAS